MTRRPRLRDLGITIGVHPPGDNNAITDVGGVQVGHCTLFSGEGSLEPGEGPVRTGVTAILPNAGGIFHERVTGGGFVLNGAGELSGLTQVQEWGLIETPIVLTNTLSVGTCSEAVVDWMIRNHAGIGHEHDVILPLVGECDDSWVNDAQGRHVRPKHVFDALESATGGPVAEGNVGGGTGMVTCDLSGGIGTSSRVVTLDESTSFKVGVLVMTNFGNLEDLRVDGAPFGRYLSREWRRQVARRIAYGSIIVVVATDAPLMTHQLGRLAKRAALGVGRTGSIAAHGSGEIILAFSTSNVVPRELRERTYKLEVLADPFVNPIYVATIEATEEAILNAMCAGVDITGRDDHFVPAIPLDLLEQYMAHVNAA